MYNDKSDWDKGFEKGLQIGIRVGYVTSEIDEVCMKLREIRDRIGDDDIVVKINSCINCLTATNDQFSEL